MTRIEELLNSFKEIAYNPEKQMAKYKAMEKIINRLIEKTSKYEA